MVRATTFSRWLYLDDEPRGSVGSVNCILQVPLLKLFLYCFTGITSHLYMSGRVMLQH